MRENLMSGSMWQGMGNQDMALVLRHSQKKWRATGLPCLCLWHHPLTLPTFKGRSSKWHRDAEKVNVLIWGDLPLDRKTGNPD